MCPSMANRDSYTPKPQKISSVEVSSNHANSSKFLHHFLYKAIIVTVFLVILPLLPSQLAPEFISQNLQYSRSWELLQLIFVGIAVSCGLFSKRNDETDKEHNYSKFDNAQSYVSRLLQVSSVFDDESENPSLSDDNNSKVQTWNSQYYRGEPVVMVAKESPVHHQKQNVIAGSKIDEKPLLLPIRSLKSRFSEPNDTKTAQKSSVKTASVSGSNTDLGSKRFAAGNSRKSRTNNGEVVGACPENMEENNEENVVHRSPIPWRSRSGRMEMKDEDEDVLPSYSLSPTPTPTMVETELNSRLDSSNSVFRSQSFRSSKPNSASPSSQKNQSPNLPYLSSESQAKSVEDVVRRNIYHKSSTPPAPPPPPPPSFLHKSPQIMKPKSVLTNNKLDSPRNELRRSIRSVPNDLISKSVENEGSSHRRANSSGSDQLRPQMQGEVPALGKSVRAIRQRQNEAAIRPVKAWEFDEDITTNGYPREVEGTFKMQTFMEFPKEEEKGFIKPVPVETDDSETEGEDDYTNGGLGSSGIEEPAKDNASNDEGPDVDKKADEFIAKFREQIRLQRIQSIRRSAEQNARNQSR